MMEDGGWRMENRGWRMEDGECFFVRNKIKSGFSAFLYN